MEWSYTVDLESLLVGAFEFLWNWVSRSMMQPATFLKFYAHNAVVKCKTELEMTWYAN